MNDFIIILLMVLGLIMFRKGCLYVFRNKNKSKLMWNLNRIRSSLAYEGDPGPYKDKVVRIPSIRLARLANESLQVTMLENKEDDAMRK